MTVRDVWEKYQEGNSSQQNFIPEEEVLKLLKEADIQASDSVLVVANIEVYTTLLDQKSHGLVNFSSIKFATDIESLKGREEVLVVDFADFDLEEVGKGFDKVVGRVPYLGKEGDLLGEGTFNEKMERLFGQGLINFPISITNVKRVDKYWHGIFFTVNGKRYLMCRTSLMTFSLTRNSSFEEQKQFYSMCSRNLRPHEGLLLGGSASYLDIKNSRKIGKQKVFHTSTQDLIKNVERFTTLTEDVLDGKFLPPQELMAPVYIRRTREKLLKANQEQIKVGQQLKEYLSMNGISWEESVSETYGIGDLLLKIKMSNRTLIIGVRRSGKSIWVLATCALSRDTPALQNKEKYYKTSEGIRFGNRPRQPYPSTVEEAIQVLEEFRKDLSKELAITSVYPNTIVEIWEQDFFQS